MRVLATVNFLAAYECLTAKDVARVDALVTRLADDPSAAWARQNRVIGDLGVAWIVVAPSGSKDLCVYWRSNANAIELLLLLRK